MSDPQPPLIDPSLDPLLEDALLNDRRASQQTELMTWIALIIGIAALGVAAFTLLTSGIGQATLSDAGMTATQAVVVARETANAQLALAVTDLASRNAALEQQLTQAPTPTAVDVDALVAQAMANEVARVEGQITLLNGQLIELQQTLAAFITPTTDPVPATATALPTPVVITVTISEQGANLRSGPGGEFDLVATADPRITLIANAATEGSDTANPRWVRVLLLTEDGLPVQGISPEIEPLPPTAFVWVQRTINQSVYDQLPQLTPEELAALVPPPPTLPPTPTTG